MNIYRSLTAKILHYLVPGKVVLLYGPRRVGKTTILKEIIATQNEQTLFLSGEFTSVQDMFSTKSMEAIKQVLGSTTLLLIDEAQYIPDIGQILKIIVDFFPHIKVIATGSASFELARAIGEPLTGRKWTTTLYPIAVQEILKSTNLITQNELFSTELIYGMYPEVFSITTLQEKRTYLEELVDAYLFKDIFALEEVRNSKKLRDLLVLLAFQIGGEVSIDELANTLGIHRATVERYLDLYEKAFIIKNIRGFSRNLRKEVNKTSKYYFYDNGIRNAIIGNFNPIHLRDDIGKLFENFMVMERIKRQEYLELRSNNYFWRTYDQKEIDLIEERDGSIQAFEFKWNNKKASIPKEFLDTYPTATGTIIHQDNYLDFLT